MLETSNDFEHFLFYKYLQRPLQIQQIIEFREHGLAGSCGKYVYLAYKDGAEPSYIEQMNTHQYTFNSCLLFNVHNTVALAFLPTEIVPIMNGRLNCMQQRDFCRLEPHFTVLLRNTIQRT